MRASGVCWCRNVMPHRRAERDENVAIIMPLYRVSVRTTNKNKYRPVSSHHHVVPSIETIHFKSPPISSSFSLVGHQIEKQANAKRTIMRKQSVEVGKSSKCTQEIKK